MWYARSGGSKTPLRTTDANLDCVFVRVAIVLVVPINGGLAPPVHPTGFYYQYPLYS